IVVVGYKKEEFEDYFSGSDVRIVEQEEALGTAHAALQARPHIDGKTVILNGDDIYGEEVREAMQHDSAVVAGRVDEPENFGVFAIEDDRVVGVEEKPDEPDSDLVNIGCYVVQEDFFDLLEDVEKSERGEYEITDALEAYIDTHDVQAIVTETWLPCSYPRQLGEAHRELVLAGEDEKEVAETAEIGENVELSGSVQVSEGAVISESRVENSVIYEDARIEDSRIVNSTVRSGAEVVDSALEDAYVNPGAIVKDEEVEPGEGDYIAIVMRETRVGIDFDRVLFKTDEFKQFLEEKLPGFNEKYARTGGIYDPEKHAERLGVDREEIFELLDRAADFIYEDIDKLRELDVDSLFIVSRGDPVFQREKIERSGASDLVDDVEIVEQEDKDVRDIDFLVDDTRAELEQVDAEGFHFDREKHTMEDLVKKVRELKGEKDD
ncbi:MAG: sugar phosphate nucleotidyltransferase, partial [Candidatus Nanohaloarchaea archaeon]